MDSDEFLLDCRIAEAAANAEKTQAEAELAKWTARTAHVEYEQARINHEHQLDGVYSFYKEITEKSCNKLLRTMKVWHDYDPKGAWTIYLNSIGGDLMAGLALLDELIVNSIRGGGNHHVTIKVRGEAASMAGILLQAADLRLIGPSSHLMVHEPSSFLEGTMHQVKDHIDWVVRWWDSACELYAGRSKLTKTQIAEKALKNDWWMTASEAVEWGFADDIG